jgi:hypothetical protein
MYSVCVYVCVCVCVLEKGERAFLQLDAIRCSVNVNSNIYCISRHFCLERFEVTL